MNTSDASSPVSPAPKQRSPGGSGIISKRGNRRVSPGDKPSASLWAGSASLPEINLGFFDIPPLSSIRDSLYDVIPLGPLELDLIATAEFVRLQGVKQLGFCYRVWPGATHTRFEHSLGVYFLMRRALINLQALLSAPNSSLYTTPADL